MHLKWLCTMKSKCLFLFTVLACIVSCACSKGGNNEGGSGGSVTPPDPEPVGFQRYVKNLEFMSKTLREYIDYSIYLPAGYETDTDKRYAVVYMLHGLGDNNNSWNGSYLHANSEINKMEAKGMSEMIYVFPKGFSSYYCNFYDGSYNYMDMFVNEFIPHIDKEYRTIADREHRSVTGYSMGGFGAIALAEKHPEVFIACAPLSMSVRTDWQYMEESQSGWENQWGIIFGGIGQRGEGRITEYYKQHCPLHYFNKDNLETLSAVNWYLICGDDEKNLLYSNDELHCILRNNGYKHEYRVVDGGHSSSVWNPALEEVLPMFDYYMNGGNLWSPDFDTEVTEGSVETEEDGAYVSPVYKEKKTGTVLYIAHDGLPASDLNAIMAAIQIAPNFDQGYVMVPCDVSDKLLSSWMSIWDSKYPNDKKLILGIGSVAKEALALPGSTFKRSYYINPDCDASVSVLSSQALYFAGTDEDLNYQGMDYLYYACKNAGSTFEYRVVNASDNPLHNILNSIKAIKSYIYY